MALDLDDADVFFISPDAMDHPKMLRLATDPASEIGFSGAVGLVVSLVCWLAKYRRDGNVTDMSDEAIARAIDRARPPVEGVRAMKRAGWIEGGYFTELGARAADGKLFCLEITDD